MTATAIASDEPHFRLKIVPLIVTAALGFGVPFAGAFLAFFCDKLFHLGIAQGSNVSWLYIQHAGQLIVALIVIAILKYWLVPADYGLHWPRGKTYIWPAIIWGVIFGVLMTLADQAPQLIAHARPKPDFPLTPANIWGWTFFEGIYVGPTEEIPFRALLVTYLAATMPGKLRMGRFNMNWAGVAVAVIFALLHAESFFSGPWALALAQQFYAFVLGVLYAYWLEKSGSIVAPIIGHNLSDVVETLLVVGWASAV